MRAERNSYQYLSKADTMQFVLGLAIPLLSIASIYAIETPVLLSPFPRDRTLVYKYHGQATTGTALPVYVSQYEFSADFIIQPYLGDSKQPNAFIAAFRNFSIRMHNGPAAENDYRKYISVPHQSPGTTRHDIENEFLIVYDIHGQLEGVKLSATETEASKNIKKALASMFRINIHHLEFGLGQSQQPHTLMINENTIRGSCLTRYSVNPNLVEDDNEKPGFIATKIVSPKNCTNSEVFKFDHYDYAGCSSVDNEEYSAMDSETVYEIEKEQNKLIVKSVGAYGGVRFTSPDRKVETHYALNNVSMVLEENRSAEKLQSSVDFSSIPLTTDLRYRKVEDLINSFTSYSGPDKQRRLLDEITYWLNTAIEHMQNNHLNPRELSQDRGDIINEITQKMSLLEVGSFKAMFTSVKKSPVTVRNLFFEILPHVGTHASVIFIRDLMVEHKMSYFYGLSLLSKFPMNVRNPTMNLLKDMRPIAPLDAHTISSNTQNVLNDAAVLSYASLMDRTFQAVPRKDFDTQILEKYINDLRQHLQSPNFNHKLTVIAALGNIRAESANDILFEIIYNVPGVAYSAGHKLTDEQILSLRLLAAASVKFNPTEIETYVHDLLMSAIRNSDFPIQLRIALYDTVVRNAPEYIHELDYYIRREENEHLYNYHYTTVENLVKSKNLCSEDLRRSILRNITMPSQLSYRLSGSHILEAIDEETGKGERFAVSYIVDQKSGFPEVVTLEHFVIDGCKWASTLRVQAVLRNVIEPLFSFILMFMQTGAIQEQSIRKILKKASDDIVSSPSSLHTIISYKDRVVCTQYRNQPSQSDYFNEMLSIIGGESNDLRHILSYYENSERQVVGEIGLPINIEIKTPVVIVLEHKEEAGQFARESVSARLVRHGHRSLAVYNPFGNLWHQARRNTELSVQIPTIPFLAVDSRDASKTIVSIKSRESKKPEFGVSAYASDATVVTDDEDFFFLNNTWPNYSYHHIVKSNTSNRRNFEDVIDFGTLGHQFSKTIFDCEDGYVDDLLRKDFFKSLFKESKESWKELVTSAYLAARQYLRTMLPDPGKGTCGVMYKLRPSVKYPTVAVRLEIAVDYADTDVNDTSIFILNGRNLKIHGVLGPYSSTAKVKQLPYWKYNIETEINKEHTWNTLSAQFNKISPGENILTICVNASKSYPEIQHDTLNLGWTREETTSRLTFSMAETIDDRCSCDDTFIDIRIKGELSDEQKEKFMQDTVWGACGADMRNPLLSSPHNPIPRTVNCLDHAIRYTTLRNYTVDMDYRNIPADLAMFFTHYADQLKVLFLPRGVYEIDATGVGKAKMTALFPFNKRSSDVNGNHQDVPRHDHVGPDADRNLWKYPLDNTRFPTLFLQPYVHSDLRICSLHPKVIRTLDGGMFAYNFTEPWTLVSGDYVSKSYAIFVNSVDGMMGWKLVLDYYDIELAPKPGGYDLKINGNATQLIELMAGTRLPDQKQWRVRITTYGSAFVIELPNQLVTLIYNFDSVTVVLSDFLQGRVVGLCGDMNGTHKTTLPDTYVLRVDKSPKLNNPTVSGVDIAEGRYDYES